MIQDRLTAQFRTAKPAVRAVVKTQPAAKAKSVKAPVADIYTKGRRIIGSFWL